MSRRSGRRSGRPATAWLRWGPWALALLLQGPAWALDPGRAFHQYVRDVWTLEQGLPQPGTTAVAQSDDGYLWVGTLDGLVRFDGARFRRYTPDDEPALADPRIQALRPGPDGRLWIATGKGLSWARDGRFVAVPVENPAADGDIAVEDVLPLPDGDALAATPHGLYRVVDGRLQQVPGVNGPLFALFAQAGQHWAGALGGVWSGRGSQLQFEPIPGLAPTVAVTGFAVTGQGDAARLWAATGSGLYVRDADGWHPAGGLPLPVGAAVGLLYADHDGSLWIGTADGLVRRQGDRVEAIANEPDARWDLAAACEDREGDLWFASRSRGLIRLWNGLARRYGRAEGLSSPAVHALAPGPGTRLWVGTDDGVSQWDDGRFQPRIAGAQLPDPKVEALFADGDRLWIGTARGAALWQTQTVRDLPGLAGRRIAAIARDAQQSLWFATDRGVFRMAPDAATPTPVSGLPGAAHVLFASPGGGLLIGTAHGLFEGQAGGTVSPVAGPPATLDVTAIDRLPDDRLLIGSADGQLWVGDHGTWTAFGTGDGLPAGAIGSLGDNSRGIVWIGSDRGLYSVSADALRQHLAPTLLPLAVARFGGQLAARPTGRAEACCAVGGNGRSLMRGDQLWLATADGLLSVPTDALPRNPVPPPVRIEALRADGISLQVDHGTLHLPQRTRSLEIELAVLSFQDPTAVRLQVRLRGIDPDWRTITDPQRIARYRDLPPGRYVFEARATNDSGIWSRQPAQIRFALPGPFYRSVPGIAAALIGLLILVGLWRRQGQRPPGLPARTEDRPVVDKPPTPEPPSAIADAVPVPVGLLARDRLLAELPALLARLRAAGAAPPADDQVLLFARIDLDHFHRVQDGHGEACAERVLQQCGQRLADLVRIGDAVATWSRDGFLLVSRPLSHDNVEVYVRRLSGAIAEEPFDAGAPHPLRLTASIGFAELPLHPHADDVDWSSMIEHADRALYRVQAQGGQAWARFQTGEPPIADSDLERVVGSARPAGDTLRSPSAPRP